MAFCQQKQLLMPLEQGIIVPNAQQVSARLIITSRFIIGHIGRTGGDAIRAIFKKLCEQGLDLPERLDEADNPKKHQTPARFERGKRIVTLSIRRLPSWEMSFMHCRLGDPRATPPEGTHYGPDEMIRGSRADQHLRTFTGNGTVPIDTWIRMESLRRDLAEFLGRFYSLSSEQLRTIATLPTKAALEYDHNIQTFFSAGELQQLYAANPAWAAVEREAYGNLLCEI